MSRAIYMPEAERDLTQIAEYIARDNLHAALAWVRELQAACDLLATQPAIGELIGTVRFGKVRRHAVGNYVIYYDPMDDGISVIRIVHGAREQIKLTDRFSDLTAGRC
jgi:toxin ParE1/3/4